jgi:hypothetical protein
MPYRLFTLTLPFWVRPYVGLALASLCGGARFYYYAMMLGTSPYRQRRDLIDQLLVYSGNYETSGHYDSRQKGQEIPMYWGERKFTTAKLAGTEAEISERASAFRLAFPKWARARISAEIVPDQNDDATYSIEVVIPIRCRVAAIFEDIDYAAPVWLNICALLFFLWSLLGQRIAAALAAIHSCV